MKEHSITIPGDAFYIMGASLMMDTRIMSCVTAKEDFVPITQFSALCQVSREAVGSALNLDMVFECADTNSPKFRGRATAKSWAGRPWRYWVLLAA